MLPPVTQGLGGLDAIFAELKCVKDSGIFLLHLGVEPTLSLSYDDHEVQKVLSSEDLVVRREISGVLA